MISLMQVTLCKYGLITQVLHKNKNNNEITSKLKQIIFLN